MLFCFCFQLTSQRSAPSEIRCIPTPNIILPQPSLTAISLPSTDVLNLQTSPRWRYLLLPGKRLSKGPTAAQKPTVTKVLRKPTGSS